MLVVKGMSITGFSIGDPLGVQRCISDWRRWERVVSALYDSGQVGWYTAVDMTNPVDIRLETAANIAVELGQADDLPRQLETAGKALTKCASLEVSGGTLDVTDPYSAAYSPQPTPQPTPPQPEGTVEPSAETLQTENQGGGTGAAQNEQNPQNTAETGTN